MARWSRMVLLGSFGVAVLFALFVYASSPEIVPVHYEASGLADSWGSRSIPLFVQLGMVVLGTLAFLSLPECIRRLPETFVNLPNKGYWLAAERRDHAAAKVATWADYSGAALNSLMILIQFLTWMGIRNQERGISGTVLLSAVCLYMTFLLGSCVWLVRAFRLPRDLSP